jgi:hypothetical protein
MRPGEFKGGQCTAKTIRLLVIRGPLIAVFQKQVRAAVLNQDFHEANPSQTGAIINPISGSVSPLRDNT